MYTEVLNLKKEVGSKMKSKETYPAELIRSSYVTIVHQPVTTGSNACSQIHMKIKHSLAHLQHLITNLAGVINY